MGTERTVRLALLEGPSPLRLWERACVEQALAVQGVFLLGHARSTEQAHEHRSSLLFDRFVRRAKERSRSLRAVQHDGLFGAERSLDALLDQDPDVVLCLCGADGNGVGRKTTFGVWSFRNGDGAAIEDAAPGLRESIGQQRLVHFELRSNTENHVIRSGCFAALPRDPLGCCERVLETASHWPAQVLSGIVATGAIPARAVGTEIGDIPTPGLGSMLGFHFGRSGGKSRHKAHGALEGEWNIGLLHQPIHVLLQEGGSMNVRWLPSPSKGKARLEPFGYFDGEGDLNVLYRKSEIADGHSVIARVRPKPDNILKRSRTMLDLDGEHAYPFIVLIDGQLHVLRSSWERSCIELFRANEANDALEQVSVIAQEALHAPTLFEHDGRWWLMGTDDDDGDLSLVLLHAASPLGPFLRAGVGAVKCDVRSARPAGTPFVHQGSLYRPSFDASDPGLPSVVLNRVTRLDEWGFEEEPVRRISGFVATSYGHGVRTLSAMGDVTLVDGLRSPTLTGAQANASRGKRRRSRPKADE